MIVVLKPQHWSPVAWGIKLRQNLPASGPCYFSCLISSRSRPLHFMLWQWPQMQFFKHVMLVHISVPLHLACPWPGMSFSSLLPEKLVFVCQNPTKASSFSRSFIVLSFLVVVNHAHFCERPGLTFMSVVTMWHDSMIHVIFILFLPIFAVYQTDSLNDKEQP